jgi:hypothetical protein
MNMQVLPDLSTALGLRAGAFFLVNLSVGMSSVHGVFD